ncbi:MAG: heme exporter protein CcmD [Alphaproteobacteria bacterium]|nr:heme exporter protein CcmD [Alphaproteobacteria bacterium]
MENIAEFLAMGGYGAFIWPSYLIAAAVLIGLLAQTLVTLWRRERTLAALRATIADSDAEKDAS